MMPATGPKVSSCIILMPAFHACKHGGFVKAAAETVPPSTDHEPCAEPHGIGDVIFDLHDGVSCNERPQDDVAIEAISHFHLPDALREARQESIVNAGLDIDA